MAVYLVHFDRPFYHARHYLGFAVDVEARLEIHRNPREWQHHKLMRAIHAAGIGFVLARVWPDGDRKLERQLKRRKSSPRLCPLCQEARRRAA